MAWFVMSGICLAAALALAARRLARRPAALPPTRHSRRVKVDPRS